MKYILFLIIPYFCLFCSAEDFELVDGTVLHEAKFIRKEGDRAVIRYSTGAGRIKYDRLPPELQQRFGLTPQEVQAYYDKIEQEKREKEMAEERLAAAQRAALQEAALSPRYVTGADIIAIYSAWDTIPASCAEYMAAEWNRREAARCNLTVEAKRFAEEADRLVAHMKEHKKDIGDEKRRVAELEEELQDAKSALKKARETVKTQRKQMKELSEKATKNHGTVIISNPTYVPVYRPVPVLRPPLPPRRLPHPHPRF